MEERKMEVIRPTDAEAIRLAKTLMRSARFGAIAVIEPESGIPFASRVGVASDLDGTPLILISGLAAHTQAIATDPRCSLLVGEPGKGDALAYPRLTLVCRAKRLERGTLEGDRAKRRYLNRNPKAKLYADLGDFAFFRLETERASLNGGFGKAFLLTRDDLIVEDAVNDELAASEQSALDHMNEEHRDAISIYARHFAKAPDANWVLSGFDIDGMDLVAGDDTRRVFFPERLKSGRDLRVTLVEMAKAGRTTEDEQRKV